MPNLGADPEFFVFNDKGRVVPAHMFFPARDNKLTSGNGTYYRDGYALELNPYPNSCREIAYANTMNVYNAALRRLPKGYSLRALPSVRITKASLKDAPPDVLRFGCEPSRCAYDSVEKTANVDAATHPYRYAGGHLHISEPRNSWAINQWAVRHDIKRIEKYIRMCDLYIGVPLTYWFSGPDQFRRRRFYGQAGEYRLQTYNAAYSYEGTSAGIEYRTPSPEMWNHPSVYSYAMGVMRAIYLNFRDYENVWDSSLEPAIREAVNTGKGITKLLPKALIPGFTTLRLLQTMKRWRPRRKMHTEVSNHHGFSWWTHEVARRNSWNEERYFGTEPTWEYGR